jgi:hypothetical protein
MNKRSNELHDEMSEEEIAQYYDEHRGDTSLWEEKPRQARIRPSESSIVISVRFSRQELAQVRLRAEQEGKTISEVIRSAVLREQTTVATDVFIGGRSFTVEYPGHRAPDWMNDPISNPSTAGTLGIQQTLRELTKTGT